MGLRRYRSKRDFAQTPEPRGRVEKRARRLRFVVQKHDARRLHYDFRLELDGVLKSWAVPNGPSLDPSVKRLAVHVEDHPISYASFEGVIPQGHYGAGNVIVWDEGTWVADGDAAKTYRAGKLEFRLDGAKLRGLWKLVRMRGRERSGKENWLLIKGKDEEAHRGAGSEITAARPESVKSGVDVDDVAKPAVASKRSLRPAGVKKSMPARIRPQLATLVDRMPEGDGWAFEIKYDGYRVLARVKGGEARLFTRNGKDWTDRFRRQARELERLPLREAWIDGEMCVFGADGMTNFQALQNACSEGADRDVIYMAFDLLHLDGRDLRGLTLDERKRLLKDRLAGLPDATPVRYSDHVEGTGREIYEHACQHQLEGLIGKRVDSTYEAKRTLSWVKVKCRRRQELVIGGYTEPQGSRTGFGALLVGVHEKNCLRYAGRVGTGFDGAMLGALRKRFAKLERNTAPFADAEKIPGRRLHWLDPELVAEIHFAGWTNDGILRQASFVSLRDDKPASKIRRERAVKTPKTAGKGRAVPESERGKVAGIVISHPDRVLFRDTGFTKLDLARYYESVAEWMLPHVGARPLSLVRCPQGPGEKCFFQKHLEQGLPQAVDGVSIREKGGQSARYVVANAAPALVALVQMGVVEFHTWGARSRAPEAPDRLILDLDPGPGVAWARVVEAATLARALFDELGLKSFLKTTGGKGLHVVVPLAPRHDWDEVKDFSRAAAEQMERTFPSRYTSKMSKAGRKGKIFIDYLRNGRGATAVAAYSVRARPGAPVSVPLGWDELTDGVRSNTYTANNVLELLRSRRADPWAGYSRSRQRITRAMKRALGAGG